MTIMTLLFLVVLFVIGAFVVAAPGESQFQGCLRECSGQVLVAQPDVVHVPGKAVTAFQSDTKPAEHIDFHTRRRLNNEHVVIAFTRQFCATPAEFDVQHGVQGFIRYKRVSDFAAIEPEIEALVVSLIQNDIVAQAVVRPAYKKRFPEFEAEKAAPVKPVGAVEVGVLVAVTAPDSRQSPTAFSEYGLLALGK